MARIDSFLKKWASVPSQFERPTDALIDRGWAGGAAEDPPEAKWENWWHNRVDEALAEIESHGALQWFASVPYGVGATSHQGGKNWIAAIANTGIDPAGVDNAGHWIELGASATETAAGPSKIATQAQTDAGTDDATIVTPKKLRMGFAISLGVNSYIVFPSWLGGAILQFGVQPYADISVSQELQITFPLAFPNALRSVVASPDSAQDVTLVVANRLSTGFTAIMREGNTNVAGGDVVWFAIGN